MVQDLRRGINNNTLEKWNLSWDYQGEMICTQTVKLNSLTAKPTLQISQTHQQDPGKLSNLINNIKPLFKRFSSKYPATLLQTEDFDYSKAEVHLASVKFNFRTALSRLLSISNTSSKRGALKIKEKISKTMDQMKKLNKINLAHEFTQFKLIHMNDTYTDHTEFIYFIISKAVEKSFHPDQQIELIINACVPSPQELLYYIKHCHESGDEKTADYLTKLFIKKAFSNTIPSVVGSYLKKIFEEIKKSDSPNYSMRIIFEKLFKRAILENNSTLFTECIKNKFFDVYNRKICLKNVIKNCDFQKIKSFLSVTNTTMGRKLPISFDIINEKQSEQALLKLLFDYGSISTHLDELAKLWSCAEQANNNFMLDLIKEKIDSIDKSRVIWIPTDEKMMPILKHIIYQSILHEKHQEFGKIMDLVPSEKFSQIVMYVFEEMEYHPIKNYTPGRKNELLATMIEGIIKEKGDNYSPYEFNNFCRKVKSLIQLYDPSRVSKSSNDIFRFFTRQKGIGIKEQVKIDFMKNAIPEGAKLYKKFVLESENSDTSNDNSTLRNVHEITSATYQLTYYQTLLEILYNSALVTKR